MDENLVKSEFEDKIKIINTHLIVMWDKVNTARTIHYNFFN